MGKPPPRAPGRLALCRDCPIGCHIDKGGQKKDKAAAYAALWGLERGADGFDEFLAAYHRLCDDIGLEAFETAAAIALGLQARLAEASFRGILEAVEQISRGTELGRLLGGGAESAGLILGLAPRAGAGPRKSPGRSEAEDFFLDSTGLCAYAYSALPDNPDLWEALEELLKAKYGPSFDVEKLKNMAPKTETLAKTDEKTEAATRQ